MPDNKEDSKKFDFLYGDCTCGWKDSDIFWKNDADDKARYVEKMRQRHSESHPECKKEPDIRSN